MPVRSAGLMIYRWSAGEPQILLVHPGGPFWARKDEAAWSIPKGLVDGGEDEFSAALRETQEEIGIVIQGAFSPLGEFRQPGGKIIAVWSVKADPSMTVDRIKSNEFEMEWPPGSGRRQTYPEVDRAAWFTIAQAAIKMHKGQRPMLTALKAQIDAEEPE